MTAIPDVGTLLNPISADYPCGANLRLSPAWAELRQLWTEDDRLPRGPWLRDLKSADWPQVAEGTADFLRTRSKDLRIAARWGEAQVYLNRFTGLTAAADLVRELLVRFWHFGLHPCEVESHETRLRALTWIASRWAHRVRHLQITESGGCPLHLVLQVAAETGEDPAVPQVGGILAESLREAIVMSSESWFGRQVEQLSGAALALERLSHAVAQLAPGEQTFQDLACLLARCQALYDALHKMFRPGEQPRISTENAAEIEVLEASRSVPSVDGLGLVLQSAELMIARGEFDGAIAALAQLRPETLIGRYQFYRNLLFAEVCLMRRQHQIAGPLLEELALVVGRHDLEKWESPQLVARVWRALYELIVTLQPAPTDRNWQSSTSKS